MDLVLTNIPERIISIEEMGRLGSSDHEMIRVTVGMQNRQDDNEKCGLNWKKANWSSIKEDTARIERRQALQGRSAEEMWTIFRSEVEEIVKKHVPDRKIPKGGRAAWMNRDLMAAVRRKKRLWRRAKGGGSMEDYKEADRHVKKMIRNVKRSFEKKLSAVQGGSSRPFYSYVKRKTKSRPAIGPLIDTNNRRVSDDKGMAELLNGFFSSVFTREDLQNQPKAADMDMETGNLERVNVTEKRVREKIKNLKPYSAA